MFIPDDIAAPEEQRGRELPDLRSGIQGSQLQLPQQTDSATDGRRRHENHRS